MFNEKVTFILASGNAHTSVVANRVQISSINRLGIVEGGREQIEHLKSITMPMRYNKSLLEGLNAEDIKYISLVELSGDIADDQLIELLERGELIPVGEIRDNRHFRRLAHIKVVVKC